MPKVIGLTEDGREIVRHDPSEGCQFRCTTCGNWLYRRAEVRGHWALYSGGHSVFVDRKNRVHHQTAEGLHRRDWPAPEADHSERTEGESHE
jgi:pyruvate-formate lyase-activating enzyme